MKNKGLNNFDIVYYINLEHRKDRYIHINNELSKTNIDPNKINRIDAVYNINKGCLGCSKSHILALEAFINTSDEIQNCIIFEDSKSGLLSAKSVNPRLLIGIESIYDKNELKNYQ